jgi:hypothetical protein
MTAEEMKERLYAFFHRRQRDYSITFSRTNISAQRVVADLQDFCCGNRTTVGGDHDQMMIREGRRQVWLRIQRALNLTPEEQFNLSNQKDQP